MGMEKRVCGVRRAMVVIACVVFLFDLRAENFVFPKNAYVKDVTKVSGAKGDGSTDDTKALQAAFKDRTGIIQLPNGTYRVTDPILCDGVGGGPWVYGQSRDGVILKLDNGASGFSNASSPSPVLAGTYHQTGEPISADQFSRQWHNFTVDVGNNAGAIGIRNYSNSVGSLDNVRIIGKGKYGLDLGWVDQNGPCLIENVQRGFETLSLV